MQDIKDNCQVKFLFTITQGFTWLVGIVQEYISETQFPQIEGSLF
jgi:hypothetical protein